MEERLSNKIEETMFSVQRSGRRHSTDPSQIVNSVMSEMPEYGSIMAVPILLSFLREDLPWVYELGMEGYRRIKMGDLAQGHVSFQGLLHLFDLALQSVSDRPELRMSIIELRQVLRNVIGHS